MILHHTPSPVRATDSQISPWHELPEENMSPKQSNSTNSFQAYQVKLVLLLQFSWFLSPQPPTVIFAPYFMENI